MTTKDISILIVDDEEPIRRLLKMCLEPYYTCFTADSAEEATPMLESDKFNLVITDIRMAGSSGLELCHLVQKMSPDTVVIMISGMTDIQFAIQSMREGAFDYVTKPFDLDQVLIVVERALRYQGLVEAKQRYEQSLEESVRDRTSELRTLNIDLDSMLETLYANYRATLRSLAKALEARDVETRGHSDRVVAYCLRLGREFGLNHNELIALEQGALLHDIGKIGIRDSILLKEGPLSEAEWAEMRTHVHRGLDIIDGIDFLSGARAIVGEHHEKFDGSGYPNGVRAEKIHVNARIFSVADTFDAITSDRPYRNSQPYAAARAEIMAHAGKQFDPRVVNAFLRIPEGELAEIREAAGSQDYIEKIIDKREIRSFIVSLKRHTGQTAPLILPQAEPMRMLA